MIFCGVMNNTPYDTLPQLQAQIIKNKVVIVRVDYNVPLDLQNKKNQIQDDTRIVATFKTIEFLLLHKAKVVLISHLGRPKGKVDPVFSLLPIKLYLEKKLHTSVDFIDSLTRIERGTLSKSTIHAPITLLENIRFSPLEEDNDDGFAKNLAKIADVYVNEAFSTSHRAHASIVGIAQFLPSYAGFAFAQEVKILSHLMVAPTRPFVIVIGGSKISDKVAAVRNLAKIADAVLIGGGTANNFLKAEGIDVCKSLVEEASSTTKKRSINYVGIAEELIEKTRKEKILLDGYIPVPKIILPIDVIAAPSISSTNTQTIELLNCAAPSLEQKELMYLDIGPKTIRLFKEVLLQAGTIFWNGPMGVFEQPQFSTGTKEIAQTIAKAGATTILGGGDTIASVNTFSDEKRFDYISAAGGAALEYLAGKELVGITAIKRKKIGKK